MKTFFFATFAVASVFAGNAHSATLAEWKEQCITPYYENTYGYTSMHSLANMVKCTKALDPANSADADLRTAFVNCSKIESPVGKSVLADVNGDIGTYAAYMCMYKAF